MVMNENFQRLSLCMIVKNEEEILPRCLKSVCSLVDEIIIVDTGSTDLTLSVAKDFCAQIFSFAWDDNFSSARNYSLDQASGDWILVLDADEILAFDSAAQFKLLINSNNAEAYFIRVVSLLRTSYGIETDEYLMLRLFRNRPEYRFSGAIQEQVYPSVINHAGANSVKQAPLTIYHDGYHSEIISKPSRNLQVIKKALGQNPREPFLLYSLGCEYFLSEKYEEALETFQQALTFISTGIGYTPDIIIKLGLCFYRVGKIPEIVRLLDSLRDISPLSPEVLFLSGLINLESGNLTETERNIKECLEALPGTTVQHLNIREYQIYQELGGICKAKKSWNEAVKFYFQAMKSKPGYLYPLQKIINLYKGQKPSLPIEDILGFCPPHQKCTLLNRLNWRNEEDIAILLILGLTRDIMLSDSYVSQLLQLPITSVFDRKQTENTGYRTTSAMHLARAIMSLACNNCADTGHITQTCLSLSQNIKDILLLQPL